MELLVGERVIFEGRPSWRSQLSYFVGWLPLALAPFVIAAILGANDVGTWLPVWQWFLVTVVLAVLVVAIDAVRRYATFYTVTDQRLRVRVGLLSRSEQTTRFDRVQNVDVRQSLMDRILKVGTVDFDTAGANDNSELFCFRGIDNPQRLVKLVAENSHFGRGRTDTGL